MRLAPCTLTLFVVLRAGLASADEPQIPTKFVLRATDAAQPQTLRTINLRDLSFREGIRDDLIPTVQPPERWVDHVRTDKVGFAYSDTFTWKGRKLGFGVKGPVLRKQNDLQSAQTPQSVGPGSRYGLIFELRF